MAKNLKPETFGTRLRRLREHAGLTQRALAALIGISGAGVARLEADHVNPSWQTAQRLADALGVSTEDLR